MGTELYGPPTPRIHCRVWESIDRISGRLSLLLSALPFLVTPAIPASVAMIVEVTVVFALFYNPPGLQHSVERSYPDIATPTEFRNVGEAMDDALVWLLPLSTTPPTPVPPPETEVVEVVREVQDPELVAELERPNADLAELDRTVRDLQGENESLVRERDDAVVAEREASEAYEELSELAERLVTQRARANVVPAEIGFFGNGGHRVVQSPPPGQEVLNEDITLVSRLRNA